MLGPQSEATPPTKGEPMNKSTKQLALMAVVALVAVAAAQRIEPVRKIIYG